MQETVLRFIFKVLCNISHVCNGVTTQYAMLRTFLKIIFYSVDKKNSSPTLQISSSWFYVLSILFPYQLIRDVTTVNWIKSVRFSTQWLKTKATVIVLHESGNYSAHQSSPRTLDLIFIVLLRLMDDVSIATEPKQNKTFESRSKLPTCAFNLDTPSTPRAFFSLSLNCCIFYFSSQIVVEVMLAVVKSMVFVLLYMVCLLSAWSQVILISICS